MNLHRPLVAFLFFIGVYASTSAQFRRDTISSTTTWAIQFTSEEVGYVVGNSGTAFKTTNRGKSWQTLTTGFTQGLRDVHFFNADTGIVVGTSGRMAATNDGGLTWLTVPSVPNTGYLALRFLDRFTGFAGGGGSGFTGIIRTQNGGSTWDTVASGLPGSPFDIYFVNDSVGLACGVSSMIRRTTDRGSTWTGVASGLTGNSVLNSIAFINDTLGWIVGQNGTLLKTVDAGASWTPQTPPVSTTLNSIAVADDSSLYACGAGGTLIYSRNRGQTWIVKNLGQTSTLQNIQFTSSRVGYVVGAGGVVIKSSTAFLDTAILLLENFEGVNPSNLNGWQVDSSAGKPWIFTNPNFAVNQIQMVLDTPFALFDPSLFVQSSPDTAYLYLPEIDIHTVNAIKLQWNEAFSTFGSPVTATIEVQDSGQWIPVFTNTNSPSNIGPGVQGSVPRSVNINAPTDGKIYLKARFKYTGPIGAFAWWAVDDVLISTDTTPNIVASVIDQSEDLDDVFQAFPNPAVQEVSLVNNTSRLIELEVYDVFGRKVKSISLEAFHRNLLDISNWSSGVYSIMQLNRSSISKKLIKL